MTTYLGKNCSFGLPRVPFVNCRQFMYLVISITETSPYKITLDLHLTYIKNWGNLGLVLKMKNIASLSILLTKHIKYTGLYLFIFFFFFYSIVACKAN